MSLLNDYFESWQKHNLMNMLGRPVKRCRKDEEKNLDSTSTILLCILLYDTIAYLPRYGAELASSSRDCTVPPFEKIEDACLP
jgi:hypothetical protein